MSATRLASILARSDCDLAQVIEVAELDQALTARLLRVANSAASAASSPVRSVREAVVRLGASSVLAMAVGAAISKQMRMAVPEYGLAEDALWRHSVASALATEVMGPHIKARIAPEAFATALLHDVGKLVIGRCSARNRLQDSVFIGGDGCLRKLENEISMLQTHHAALGGLVAQSWRLPEGIVKGILFHHEPTLGASTTCDIVCVANQVANTAMNGSFMREFSEEERGSIGRLEMTADGFRQSCEAVGNRFEKVKARFE
jgi:HD-like signal output (HDOD) protein